MSRLVPRAMLDQNPVGVSRKELVLMLRSHGFVHVNANTSAPHAIYKHPVHGGKIGIVTVAYDHGDVDPGAAKAAARACIEAEALDNAALLRNAKTPDPLPQWLIRVFGAEFQHEVGAAQVMRVTCGINGSARHYTIRNDAHGEGGELHIQSVEFPEDPGAGFKFRFHKGDRHPAQDFRLQFQELDALVSVLMPEETPAPASLPPPAPKELGWAEAHRQERALKAKKRSIT